MQKGRRAPTPRPDRRPAAALLPCGPPPSADSHRLPPRASGDGAIRLVAAAFRSILCETDIVARGSGDEFVAPLSDGDPGAADQIDDRLAAAIARQGSPGEPYTVSATVGTSTLDPVLSLRDAIERADAELYTRKKHVGRSRPTPAVDIDAVPERE